MAEMPSWQPAWVLGRRPEEVGYAAAILGAQSRKCDDVQRSFPERRVWLFMGFGGSPAVFYYELRVELSRARLGGGEGM